MHVIRNLDDEEPTEMMIETKRRTWRVRDQTRISLSFSVSLAVSI